MVREEKVLILWEMMMVVRAWGKKELECDVGRGHPHLVQEDDMRTAMGGTLEAIRTKAEWYVPVFENFVDAYHLVVMPGDSGLGDHFLQVQDKVLSQWKEHLKK